MRNTNGERYSPTAAHHRTWSQHVRARIEAELKECGPMTWRELKALICPEDNISSFQKLLHEMRREGLLGMPVKQHPVYKYSWAMK